MGGYLDCGDASASDPIGLARLLMPNIRPLICRRRESKLLIFRNEISARRAGAGLIEYGAVAGTREHRTGRAAGVHLRRSSRVKMRPPVDLNLASAQRVTPFAQRIGHPMPYQVVGVATATKPFTASDKPPRAQALVFPELDL